MDAFCWKRIKVLKRKPVIWDNIHANDYDQRRIFLGPFKGISLDLFEHTSGILKNPNCEFECNFIAIHSMAGWLRVARTFSERNTVEDESNKDKNSNNQQLRKLDKNRQKYSENHRNSINFHENSINMCNFN